MRIVLKRLFQIIGLGSFTLIACIRCKYGVPTDVDPYKAVKTITGTNQPIQGLQVTLLNNGDSVMTVITDDNGVAGFGYDFWPGTEHNARITDIDGEQNLGQFQTVDIILTQPDTTIITMIDQSR
jgi:hypothetical protein